MGAPAGHRFCADAVVSYYGKATPGRCLGSSGIPLATPPHGPGAIEMRLARGGYYAARNNGYTARRAAPFVGKALALARGTAQGLGPPHGPYREGRAAAPLALSPGLCGPGWSVAYFTHRTVTP